MLAVSCATAKSCVAGGTYWIAPNGSNRDVRQAFVVAEVRGIWGAAQAVPGLATQNVGLDAAVDVLSCAAARRCIAGGYYTTSGGAQLGFLVTDVDGSWGGLRTEPMPVLALSCAPGLSCIAALSDGTESAALTYENGVWDTPQTIPGLAALEGGGQDTATSASCAAPGSCVIGGLYVTPAPSYPYGDEHGFVVDETAGTLGQAHDIPGLEALNQGQDAAVTSVSCGEVGDCAAGGFFSPSRGLEQGFVSSESEGVWGPAKAVPGLSALNTGGDAEVESLSCFGDATCAAGGTYEVVGARTASPVWHGFVVAEVGGAWRRAVEVPGLARWNRGDSVVTSVSCGATGSCAAGGSYAGTPSFPDHSFLTSEVYGRWSSAEDVPGVTTWGVAQVNGGVTALSCVSAGECTAVGQYQPAEQMAAKSFVVSEPGRPPFCSPITTLTGAGLVASVAHRSVTGSALRFRFAFTNRGAFTCTLEGTPRAIMYRTTRRSPVGPPARRLRGGGRVLLYLPPGATADATLTIVRPSNLSRSCRPERVDEVLFRPTGVPPLAVRLAAWGRAGPIVCATGRRETISSFVPA